MTLKNVLDVISGGTPIRISANCKDIYVGCMADTLKVDFNRIVGPYLGEEVYRLNTIDNMITIAV